MTQKEHQKRHTKVGGKKEDGACRRARTGFAGFGVGLPVAFLFLECHAATALIGAYRSRGFDYKARPAQLGARQLGILRF